MAATVAMAGALVCVLGSGVPAAPMPRTGNGRPRVVHVSAADAYGKKKAGLRPSTRGNTTAIHSGGMAGRSSVLTLGVEGERMVVQGEAWL